MSMTRRGFLGFLAKTALAVTVAAHVPVEWVPTPARDFVACAYLRKQFNAWCATQPGMVSPKRVYVGMGLFCAVESELVAMKTYLVRYGSQAEMADGPKWLAFKGSRLYAEGAGYRVVRFEA